MVSGDTFSTFVSAVRQPIEYFFNWLNRLTNIQNASSVRSLSGLLLHIFGRIAAEKKVNSNNCFFGEAYNVSYTDVYDFCSKKQSLKKWEIELGIHHQEFVLPWDQPVPESMWQKVAEYCDNDVLATEAVFNARKRNASPQKEIKDLQPGIEELEKICHNKNECGQAGETLLPAAARIPDRCGRTAAEENRL